MKSTCFLLHLTKAQIVTPWICLIRIWNVNSWLQLKVGKIIFIIFDIYWKHISWECNISKTSWLYIWNPVSNSWPHLYPSYSQCVYHVWLPDDCPNFECLGAPSRVELDTWDLWHLISNGHNSRSAGWNIRIAQITRILILVIQPVLPRSAPTPPLSWGSPWKISVWAESRGRPLRRLGWVPSCKSCLREGSKN